MRLFIALPLPKQMLEAMKQTQENWANQGMKGRFSPEQNLHITLVFLGEQSEENCRKIENILEDLPFAPFALSTSQAGAFRNLLYAGLDVSPALGAYVKKLKAALRQAGISFDDKRFFAHITLVRKAVFPDGMVLRLEPAEGLADKVVLYESILHPQGPEYVPLLCQECQEESSFVEK